MPVLNVYAVRDHLVLPPSTVALGKHVGNKQDYKEMPIKTGSHRHLHRRRLTENPAPGVAKGG